MRKLTIFDDGERIAIISVIEDHFFLFARSSREWSEMNRLLDSSKKLREADPKVDVLDNLVSMLHSFNFNTELIDEGK